MHRLKLLGINIYPKLWFVIWVKIIYQHILSFNNLEFRRKKSRNLLLLSVL